MITEDEFTKRLDNLYSNIYTEGVAAILNGQETTDPFLHQIDLDKRLGLTLLISIKGTVAGNFGMVEEEIQKIEPEQYFYPESDLHVTVIDLISAKKDFVRDDLLIDRYVKIIESAVKSVSPFDLKFKGIIASNAAVLAKGYYGGGLQELRDQMRMNAQAAGMEFSERYQSISAHSTIVRFKSKLRYREQLMEIVRKYNDFEIGILKVNELELVIHDWYNRKKVEIKNFNFKL